MDTLSYTRAVLGHVISWFIVFRRVRDVVVCELILRRRTVTGNPKLRTKGAWRERETRATLLSLISPEFLTGCAYSKPRSRAKSIAYRKRGQRSQKHTSLPPRSLYPRVTSLPRPHTGHALCYINPFILVIVQ